MNQNGQPGFVMSLAESVARHFAVPRLTRGRIWFAFAVALITDAVQMMLGPLGWFPIDQGLDVVAMVLTCGALGFHLLLLPTFIVELLPVMDLLPTWTGCVAVVVALRKRAQSQPLILSTQEIPGPLPEKRAKVTEK